MSGTTPAKSPVFKAAATTKATPAKPEDLTGDNVENVSPDTTENGEEQRDAEEDRRDAAAEEDRRDAAAEEMDRRVTELGDTWEATNDDLLARIYRLETVVEELADAVYGKNQRPWTEPVAEEDTK